MNRRKVKIEVLEHSYFVQYLERKPRQRWLAAQFSRVDGDGNPRPVECVVEWVKNQPRLELVE